MQNFKIKRAPWKDNEVNSMSRKEKGRGPRRVSLCPVHYASIPFSKEKSMKSALNFIANCYNHLLKQTVGKW